MDEVNGGHELNKDMFHLELKLYLTQNTHTYVWQQTHFLNVRFTSCASYSERSGLYSRPGACSSLMDNPY
jgi:hypothetical protein